MSKTQWAIDASHSEINFKVRHMMISTVTGTFGSFNATAETEGEDFSTASVSFEASIDSINTRNEQRDGHLKSADFFDAENHPKMTFKSTGMKPNGDGGYVLEGDLTIRGVTKSVSLNADFGGVATDPWGLVRAGFELSGEINRKEFGLQWDAITEAGSIVVSDVVKLQILVEMVKQ